MGQRDHHKSENYFKFYIESKVKSIAQLRQAVVSTISEKQHTRLLFAIFKDELELWIARYSVGEDKGLLKNKFNEVVDSLDKYQQEPANERIDLNVLTDYIQSLWLISIALLLDAKVERIVKLIGQSGKDALFDALIRLKLPDNPQADAVIHPGPYQDLYHALSARGDQQNKLVLSFIENYYTAIKDVYFMDIDPVNGNYFGRWLFELAAFVKGGKVNDRFFATNAHYPKDLV